MASKGAPMVRAAVFAVAFALAGLAGCAAAPEARPQAAQPPSVSLADYNACVKEYTLFAPRCQQMGSALANQYSPSNAAAASPDSSQGSTSDAVKQFHSYRDCMESKGSAALCQ
jgi:hypothetical protein